jgi:serine/threonine protein kinase
VRICEQCGARYRGTPAQCPLDGGSLRELPDPLLGRSIGGRYLIVEKIGAGGMGTVYRARDEPSATDVAIKFLLPDLAVDPTNRERFLREARAANRIDHENIIDVNDFGETEDGQVYLVMEFLDGIALAEEIGHAALGIPRSVDIAMQCASALARAHELDVVHRDIKPENIYLLAAAHSAATPHRRDFVKILDFGLAHMKGELRLTASGAVFGTPEYMAPEQARGAPLSGRCDLYALGCVLFEMITGDPPFSGSTPDLILKHMRESAPLLSSRAKDVPPELDRLVATLLEKDPQKRHHDGYHLLEELRRIADRLPASPTTSSDSGSHRPTPRETARQDALSLPADSTGPILPEGWEQRVALLRQLVPRAYAGQSPPPWLIPAIDELSTRIAHVRVLDAELSKAIELAADRESSLRTMRLRLGRAIDELGRDESRTLRRLEELEVESAEIATGLAEAAAVLGRAFASLRAADAAAAITAEIARGLRDAGDLAQRWIERDARERSLRREIQDREQERDDLRFQISQLKGRLATAGAEQDLEITSIRERAAKLGAEREAVVDDLHGRAMAILRHFGEFPALEDAVRAATLPPPPNGRASAG